MRRWFLCALCGVGLVSNLMGQSAVNVPRPEEKEKAERVLEKQQKRKALRTSVIEFQGHRAFDEKILRTALKEQIATIDDYGLTAARADDAAFFLELFYRKHGYAKVSVRYALEGGDRLRLQIAEGPLQTLGQVTFDGNVDQSADKLFEFAVGPTRERYSKLQRTLPFVEADLKEGAELVQRLYVAEGFLDSVVDPPRYVYHDETNVVDAIIPIQEGRQYSFGNITFTGRTIYGAEALRGQIEDMLERPYTDARLANIPRRLEAYFKARGYYEVNVEAIGDPAAAKNGRIPVQITVAPGSIYRFGEVEVSGLNRLRLSYVQRRFSRLSGKTYSPDVLDEKFRLLMRTGLFNLLRITPKPADGSLLHLQITAEEAKSRELALAVGYGTFEGGILGVQWRNRNLLGYGRPVTTSAEISQRGYKGEILYEDPFFFDSEFAFKLRLHALTFDFDGYSKFELGGRVEFTRKLTKHYEAGVFFTARHVEVTSAEIKPHFLGQTSYFINSLGLMHTLDFRESPLVNPRGFVVNNTFDLATGAFGSEIDLVRSTIRLGYYIPFGPKPLSPGVVEDLSGPEETAWQRWLHQSSLAFGARAGIVHSLADSGAGETTAVPIDERFFNGGATTVRSFIERDLGPHDRRGHPIGGEFFTVFNAEYSFPIFGELQGAVFADAGNLTFRSENWGTQNMRYALGLGLRYKLPIGPIRLDYGFNPDPRPDEDFGAFHFSFGFAF